MEEIVLFRPSASALRPSTLALSNASSIIFDNWISLFSCVTVQKKKNLLKMNDAVINYISGLHPLKIYNSVMNSPAKVHNGLTDYTIQKLSSV